MFWRSFSLVWGLCAVSFPAHAYIRTISSTGHPLFWSSPTLLMKTNPLNSSALSPDQISSMLSGSFAAWSVSGSRANLSYAQGTSLPAVSQPDGQNAVYFSSNGSRDPGWGVVGLTDVFYFVYNGQIADADMVFKIGRAHV